MIEAADLLNSSKEQSSSQRYERNRLIAHLGRVFAHRYDLAVLPSRQKGFWACTLDPKTTVEMGRYVEGQRETLDDLPAESFRPKQILYDEQSAQEMSMEQITTLMRHEAGHAKYTDFRLMVEGQRMAKDEGHLPTSFWLTFEGIEDPRVNAREGEESPTIDRQIRKNQAKDLQDRLTETPVTKRPQMLQFAYNSFHYWLHGKPIPELEGTEVGRVTETARSLLEQYFENADPVERKLLQQKIWDIAKVLEKKDIEDEEKRQMAQQKKQQQGGQNGQNGQPGGAGNQQGEQTGEGSGGQPGGSGSDQEQNGQGGGFPNIPGGSGENTSQQTSRNRQGQESGSQTTGNEGQGKGRKRFLDRLKEKIFGSKDESGSEPNGQNRGESEEQSQTGDQNQTNDKQDEGVSHDIGKPKPKPEKIDLSKLSEGELREIQEAIDQLSPEQRSELAKKAREAIDEEQAESLKDKLSKLLKLQKNKQTGQYEATLQTSNEKSQKQAESDYKEALGQVEAEEQAQWQRQEQERLAQEAKLRQLEKQRRERQEMEKAGFKEDERDKFLLYQQLEDSMYSYVRNFKEAIAKVIPRRKEPKYETGYWSGPRFDKRELVKKIPTGNEQFWQRQVETPTGEPRLFIGLLVDRSFSMKGKKQEEARKTVIFFAKVCRDMGIPFMAVAFGDRAEVIKNFRQDFDNPAERIKPKLIDASEARRENTNLYQGLNQIIEAMNDQRRRLRDSHGLIFVISDGVANLEVTGVGLKDYVDNNRGRLTFKGFGLSDANERNMVKDALNLYFGESNCAYPQNFEDLPDEAFRVLRINLMQFQRYFA